MRLPRAYHGLSPRLRGNRRRCGSIPAGGTSSPGIAAGLSPRLRGNRSKRGEEDQRSALWVYPRACGGTWARRSNVRSIPRLRGNPHAAARHLYDETGLSPRLRGNLPSERYCEHAQTAIRSIPAPAGEPFAQLHPIMRLRGNLIQVNGLSPRLRGNRFRMDRRERITVERSIPAPAGEPHFGKLPPTVPAGVGLSPRLRGNLEAPLRKRTTSSSTSVYPRACGGT